MSRTARVRAEKESLVRKVLLEGPEMEFDVASPRRRKWMRWGRRVLVGR